MVYWLYQMQAGAVVQLQPDYIFRRGRSMLLIKGADVYAPEYIGKKDVLIAGGKIEKIGDDLSGCEGCQVIDGTGKIVTPGIIDRHIHITGGGGEGSFHTQAPPVQLSRLIEGGVTTVVGVLGTDGISRSVENLLAKAKSLKEEGISAYCCCGAYGYPSPTITGSVSKDIMFIDEILGLKLAISDHRAPNISVDELIRLGSDVRTAAMLSGKGGFVCLHMGGNKRCLGPVFEALEKTSIPIKTFQPTHVGRDADLQADAFRFAKMGGTIDITCGQFDKKFRSVADSLRAAREQGVPMDKVTISSDGQGSWSNYDANGHLTEMGVSDVNTVYRQIVYEVQKEGMALEEALTYGTSNVAKALELYPQKGAVCEGSDADVLILNADLTMNAVIANGTVMMKDGVLCKKGTYEA